MSLGIRVSLAAMLLTAIVYGVYTGQLSSKAPWDRQLHPDATTIVPRPADIIEAAEEHLKQG